MYKEAKSAADDAEYTKSTVYQVQNDVEDLMKENVLLKGTVDSIRDQMASMGDQMNEMMTLLKNLSVQKKDNETELTMKPECSVCFAKFSSSSMICDIPVHQRSPSVLEM